MLMKDISFQMSPFGLKLSEQHVYMTEFYCLKDMLWRRNTICKWVFVQIEYD